MVRFLIPTRNRPGTLSGLLHFLARFYPGTALIVADGSDPAVQDDVQAAIGQHDTDLRISYRPYPADLPFFERLLDAVGTIDDDYLAIGADDDFPLVDVYDKAARELEHQPNCSAVVPGDVALVLQDADRLTARLSPSRSVVGDTSKARVLDYGWWSFATSYGVTRKETLLARYRMLLDHNCPGFVDFQVGVGDALAGEIRALGALGTIRTQTYQHSYFRPTQPLVYLRHADRILLYRDHLTAALSDTGLTQEEASATAHTLIDGRIAELTGQAAPLRQGFAEAPGFHCPALQDQFRQFYALFDAGTPERRALQPQLAVIGAALRSSTDKTGGTNYETL